MLSLLLRSLRSIHSQSWKSLPLEQTHGNKVNIRRLNERKYATRWRKCAKPLKDQTEYYTPIQSPNIRIPKTYVKQKVNQIYKHLGTA